MDNLKGYVKFRIKIHQYKTEFLLLKGWLLSRYRPVHVTTKHCGSIAVWTSKALMSFPLRFCSNHMTLRFFLEVLNTMLMVTLYSYSKNIDLWYYMCLHFLLRTERTGMVSMVTISISHLNNSLSRLQLCTYYCFYMVVFRKD